MLSVAAETVDHERGDFSSNGLVFDNSDGVAIGAGGHTVFTGERVGLVHPDVAAPGVSISSSCDTAGTVVGPCPPGENATASGTSMASPHVAGAVAVLRQANPNLHLDQIRWALQTTADPVIAVDDAGEPTGEPAPFWQVGYGRVDLAEAVDAVQDRSRAAQPRAAGSAPSTPRSSPAPATGCCAATGSPTTPRVPRSAARTRRTYEVPEDHRRHRRARDRRVPVDGGAHRHRHHRCTRCNVSTPPATSSPRPSARARARPACSAPLTGSGPYTVEVVGDLAVSDPDTLDSDSLLNDTVTVVVNQLARR